MGLVDSKYSLLLVVATLHCAEKTVAVTSRPVTEALPPAPATNRQPPPPEASSGSERVARKQISQQEASQAALEYLGALGRVDSLPADVFPRTCESQCRMLHLDADGHRGTIHDKGDQHPCSLWECQFFYGDMQYFPGTCLFTVTVNADSDTVTDSLGLARCFAQPHRCVLSVKTLAARRLAGRRVADDRVWLKWDRERGEFMWEVDGRRLTSAHRASKRRTR
mgnify:CR=1 FL=1